MLHAFARTPNPPYRYFYRRFENQREWTPWETVDLDIADAPHVVPIVQGRRLNLLWTTFTQKPEEHPSVSKDQDPPPAPRFHSEIGLHWSEYRQGGWSPKQMAAKTAWWPHQLHHFDRPLPLPATSEFLCHVQEWDTGTITLWIARKLADEDNYTRLLRGTGSFTRDGATAAFKGASSLWSDATDASYPYYSWSLVVPEKAGIDSDAFTVNSRLRLKSTGLGTKLVLGTLSKSTLAHPTRTADLPAPGYYPSSWPISLTPTSHTPSTPRPT